ncbi:AEC family transporter [Candidatus Uhrbacteria bacterium]|nr:AEC family transporter [Candidatus Uhrbacteria bacterium]
MAAALLATILPTFGIIGIGLLCRRLGIWDRSAVAALNRYAYVIALPALIFRSILDADLGTTFSRADALLLAGVLGGHLAVVLAALLLVSTHGDRGRRAVAPMLLTFGSTAYLGIPYATYAFGPEGTTYAALLSVVLVVVLLFVHLGVLNRFAARADRQSTWHQLLELPFLWAVLLAVCWPIFRLPALPLALDRTLGILADSAGPTALLGLGTFLFDLKLERIPWQWAISLGIGKVVLPAVASFAILTALGIHGVRLAVGVAMGAVSTAVTAFVLSNEYRIGRELTAGAILVSTLASLAALSVISFLWVGTSVFN